MTPYTRRQIWAQRLLILLLGALVAALFIDVPAPRTHAQTGGSVQLSTAVQLFTVHTNGSEIIQNITANIGQTGHQVTYSFAPVGQTCVIQLEAANVNTGGSTWFTLGAGTDQNLFQGSGGLASQRIVATGYFPFLRLAIDSNASSLCTGQTVQLTYTGSQESAYPQPLFYAVGPKFIGAPASQFCGLGPTAGGVNTYCPAGMSQPYLLNGINCYNSSASAAFVQVYDSAAAPTLNGTGELTLPIGANSGLNWTGPQLLGAYNLWLAGTTTWNGSTGVAASTLSCSAQMNAIGPFGYMTAEAL